MIARIEPSVLAGEIGAIPSKSQAHRLLICAALAEGETVIRCAALSRDITATAECLRAMGARIEYGDGSFSVSPIRRIPDRPSLPCGESGSTLRFLLPVVCALGAEVRFRPEGRLPDRPLSPLWEELVAHSARLSKPARDVIEAAGPLSGGSFELAADVSSQFISGLLFALPLMGGGRIRLTGRTESAGYIEMTLRAMEAFGIRVRREEDGFSVPAGARYVSPGSLTVEGDWSNAAFWICADRILGGTLSITGLDPASAQGDRAAEAVSLRIAAGSAAVDCRDIPDLTPVLAVLASVSPGVTRFYNAGRLRIKESDRLATTAALIRSLGGRAEEQPEGLVVTGTPRLRGGEVSSENDHRIAMSAAVAALACDSPVILRGAEAVNKSYPGFWADYSRLGGRVSWEDEP